MTKQYSHQVVFNLPFYDGRKAEVVEFVQDFIFEDKGLLTIATPNPEHIVQAKHNDSFTKDLQQFDVFLPDGQGIIWAANVFGKPLTERITGVDVVVEVLKIAGKKNLAVMIVGGKEYGKENFQISNFKFQIDCDVKGQMSNVTCLKWVEGYREIRDMSKQELRVADEKVVLEIEKFKPEIVFVALGAPEQEAWIIRNKELLEKSGVRVAMTVGGAFDFILGKVSRAPEWIQNLGLEWLYRLIQEPWRWKRQLRLVEFGKMVVEKKVLG